MLIPEGALLFAMHPAVVDDALGRTQLAPEARRGVSPMGR